MQLLSVGFDVFQSKDSAFFHHVAKVSRQRQFRRFTAAYARLDKENFSAYCSPRQACNDTGIAVALIALATEKGLTQQLFDIFLTKLGAIKRQRTILGFMKGNLPINLLQLLL